MFHLDRDVLTNLKGPILITGHTGFKGTWLTLMLEEMGCEIVGVSLEPDRNSLFELGRRRGKIKEHFLDISNSDGLNQVFAQYQPSVVFHFAAQALVLESYKSPSTTFKTNVMGSVNVLEQALKTQAIKCVVVATTDKVYKNENLGVPFTESDPLKGKDPYSASKVGTESVISAWQHISKIQDGPKIISVRSGNVVGGGDLSRDRLLPDFIRGAISKKPIQIRNPESTRPWQHVLDPLNGYIKALTSSIKGNAKSEIYNFGPNGLGLTVGEVVQIAKDCWGDGAEIEIIPSKVGNPSNLESKYLSLNCELAKRDLAWEPKYSQSESIESTVTWWKAHSLHGANPIALMRNEIKSFYER